MSGHSADRVTALGGVFQAARLVHDVATRGTADAEGVHACLTSLFQFHAVHARDAFGGLPRVAIGLTTLARALDPGMGEPDLTITRYALGALQLQAKARRRRALLKRIRDGIEAMEHQRRHFGPEHPNVVAALADLYRRTLGEIRPRILVTGNEIHLRNPRNADLVRALLLAAFRSAFLWHQFGGRRLNLLFARQATGREAVALLRQIRSGA
ncbi:MAG: high frequency lysogenization protein HflD [Gammaproteobacteria bacterium]